MRTLILIALLTLGVTSQAAKLVSGDNTKIYIEIESGKRVNAIDADRITTNAPEGKPAVMVCQPVEKECNERTGKCTIKTVK